MLSTTDVHNMQPHQLRTREKVDNKLQLITSTTWLIK